jgi:hypothetical protein
MMWAVLAIALAGRVELTIEGVGGPVTQSQRLMLQATLQRTSNWYDTALDVPTPHPLPMHITVYTDEDAFTAIKREKGAPMWAAGFFHRRGRQAEAHLFAASNERMQATFLHEASHYLLAFGGRSPKWLNEGLAEVLESATVRGNTLTVTPTRHQLYGLSRVDKPTVRAIVEGNSAWNDLPGDEVGPLYASAWGLTAMLVESPQGQKTIKAMLSAYRRQPTNDAVVGAIESTWPGGMDGLQRDFERWIARPSKTVILNAPIRNQPSAPDALWIRCDDGRLVSRSLGCR